MSLFEQTQLGLIEVKNRICMAPMTRARCPDTVAGDSVAKYYAQRAGAGLIITEATQISSQGTGSIATPGIYTAAQIEGWSKTAQAVHARGGKIFAQIWHTGRVSHPSFHDGAMPVSASAVRGNCHTFTKNGYEATPQPRALGNSEVVDVVTDFRQAAVNAIEAGFDGVQIHAANGYLIDQFLRDGVNQRDDSYGGTVENRSRFLLEIVDAVSAAIDSGRTAVRLNPFTVSFDCADSNPKSLFLYVARQLGERNLCFVDIVERGLDPATADVVAEVAKDFTPKDFRRAYKGNLVVNGLYDKDRATQATKNGYAQMVGIGRPYMGTPDLAERWEQGQG
ncbi:MAG: alkene reductase, partial [Pseudomonadales bacterium]|nr:alkene reductase [Pseudomonadales bacterium]